MKKKLTEEQKGRIQSLRNDGKTRKELEEEIKALKKELKLYKDFLHFAGRM